MTCCHNNYNPCTCTGNGIDFEIGEYVPMVISDIPTYDGALTVNPNTTVQTLQTAGHAMGGNVVVNPIPFVEVPNDTGIGAVIGGV